MENQPITPLTGKESAKRIFIKKLCYWGFILFLDFASVYLLTKKADLAMVLMTLHIIYISTGRMLFNRIWKNTGI
jgi:hypothetical protein